MYIYSQKAKLTEINLRFFWFWINRMPKCYHKTKIPGPVKRMKRMG
jgi:hypothetical protein